MCRVTELPERSRDAVRCAGVKEGHSQLTRTREASVYKVFLENVPHNAIQASKDEFTHTDTHKNAGTHSVRTCAYVRVY